MLDKTFEPAAVERRCYALWEASGAFAADPDSAKPPYTIMMPPPNVTGSLHMGHALTFTLQDILVRYQRMRGRDALWQPGTDHAGIATEIVVDQPARRAGRSTSAISAATSSSSASGNGRRESGGTITRQLRRLGASPDWRRERFTMDPGLAAAVRRVFVALYREGLIYRDKRLVNWDPEMHTVISDLEVESRETKGSLWHIRYPIEGEPGRFIVVATTRPETMLGDTGVAVHPEDARYADLVGKSVRLPLVGRLIPIVADEYADPETGSGAVKITPAHDFNDFEVGQRHGLPMINIFDADARLNDDGAGGLSRPRPVRGAQEGRRRSRAAGPRRQDRRPHPDGAASRPLGRRHRAVADRPVVLRRRACWPSRRSPRSRTGDTAVRAAAVGEHLLRMDAQHPALVHLAPAVVGAPDPGLVRAGRHGLRRRDRGRGARRGAGEIRPRGRAAPRRGRARHLVFVGAVAVLDLGLARSRPASSRAIIRATCWSPASTSSSSGSPG